MTALISTIDLFIFFLVSLVNYVKALPASNPVYMDLFKLVIGTVTWIGGLIGFMYWREKKLKTAALNK